MGFLVVKTETQLAVLGTARKAIYIVQYWGLLSCFLIYISALETRLVKLTSRLAIMGVRSVILFLSPLLKLFVIARAALVSKVYYSERDATWTSSGDERGSRIVYNTSGVLIRGRCRACSGSGKCCGR